MCENVYWDTQTQTHTLIPFTIYSLSSNGRAHHFDWWNMWYDQYTIYRPAMKVIAKNNCKCVCWSHHKHALVKNFAYHTSDFITTTDNITVIVFLSYTTHIASTLIAKLCADISVFSFTNNEMMWVWKVKIDLIGWCFWN